MAFDFRKPFRRMQYVEAIDWLKENYPDYCAEGVRDLGQAELDDRVNYGSGMVRQTQERVTGNDAFEGFAIDLMAEIAQILSKSGITQ